ncbi:MAG: hypothetical protein II998_03300 [Clostridia bacterium]|nr:hypothetical protein [Clostridia bacterium]
MSLRLWHISGSVFIFLSGFFLHYAYDISGENEIVGYFSAVNESVWEHLKLIFWPAVVFAMPEYFSYGRKEADFFYVKLMSVFCAMCFTIVFFYTYSGILGFNMIILDVISFALGVIFCQFISFKLLSMDSDGDLGDNFRALVLFALIAVAFITWTYNPPELGIFWG